MSFRESPEFSSLTRTMDSFPRRPAGYSIILNCSAVLSIIFLLNHQNILKYELEIQTFRG